MSLPTLEQVREDIVSEMAAARLAELRTRAAAREADERAALAGVIATTEATAIARLQALAPLAERRREVLQSLAGPLAELAELSDRIRDDFGAALQPAVELARRRGLAAPQDYVGRLLDRAEVRPPDDVDLPADLPGGRLAKTIARGMIGGMIGAGWLRVSTITASFDVD